MADHSLQIGEVATAAGVSVDTVRYYEREQLLPSTGRTQGGFRLFGPEAVDRIRFIKQAQELGFTLDEIRTMLRADGSAECRHVHDLLKTKLAEVGVSLDASSTVCIVEVMKLMNHVKAGVGGEVVAVYVENGVAVDKGQPLFAIARSDSS